MNWPPDFEKELLRREAISSIFANCENSTELARIIYRDDPVKFINDWCVTYDPRNASRNLPLLMPFILFPKQKELVNFLYDCVKKEQSGLIEKSRDMGATWVCCAFSVWMWLFVDGSAVGWGSRKQELVDRIGDPKTIFDKIRTIIECLPSFFLPNEVKKSFMKIKDIKTKSSITGEGGDNIGRGGRTTIYFKDEAQPLSSKILTPNGWSTIGEMRAGSLITGPDGKSCKVKAVHDKGLHNVYRVKFSDGSFTECSPNHLWKVQKVYGKKQNLIMITKDMVKDYVYNSPCGQTRYKYRVQSVEPVVFRKRRNELPLDPYVLGALLGHGCVSNVPKNSVVFTSVDQEIIDRVSSSLPKGVILTSAHDNRSYRLVDEKGKTGKCVKSRARLAVFNSGIAGKKSHEKFIPNLYKLSSIEDRYALLQGLMDTDGSASSGVASYHSSSKQLAQDVMFIARSLGGFAKLNVKADHRGYRDMYVVHLALPNHKTPFHLSRKTKTLRKRKHPLSKTIVQVELVRRDQVRCITVDSDDGLYVTDDFIVTHNSAHYEHDELIEAALSENTNVQIDLSTVNGPNNVFARRRRAGHVPVFVMDWRDHPGKNQEWYDKRYAKAEAEGLLHKFAQEVDRDYAASMEGLLIKDEWVRAAIDADKKLNITCEGVKVGGFDVADEGGDVNAFAFRHGIFIKNIESWGEGDTTQNTYRVNHDAINLELDYITYDSVGVGAGVKGASLNLQTKIKFLPYNGGESSLNPNKEYTKGKKNKDMFANRKSQDWWLIRDRFYNTWCAINGIDYDHDKLIILPSNLRNLDKLILELTQVVRKYDGKGRVLIDKAPNSAKSPNLADAVVMAFADIKEPRQTTIRRL